MKHIVRWGLLSVREVILSTTGLCSDLIELLSSNPSEFCIAMNKIMILYIFPDFTHLVLQCCYPSVALAVLNSRKFKYIAMHYFLPEMVEDINIESEEFLSTGCTLRDVLSSNSLKVKSVTINNAHDSLYCDFTDDELR